MKRAVTLALTSGLGLTIGLGACRPSRIGPLSSHELCAIDEVLVTRKEGDRIVTRQVTDASGAVSTVTTALPPDIEDPATCPGMLAHPDPRYGGPSPREAPLDAMRSRAKRACVYSWCERIEVVPRSSASPTSERGCKVCETLPRIYTLPPPDRGASYRAPAPYAECPAALRLGSSESSEADGPVAFDPTATAQLRHGEDGICAYTWCHPENACGI